MNDVTVALVDYNMGNIRSIRNALNLVAEDVRTVSDGSDLGSPDAVVVPGVGAFSDGMENLRQRGFIDPLTELSVNEETPYLGICLGLQFLADGSTEHGTHDGFGWISGEVKRITPNSDEFRVPHMGWNSVEIAHTADPILFRGFDSSGTFYFVHSYHLDPETTDADLITASSWHGTDVTAAIRSNNIFGVQFHPEKSQGAGLKIIESFIRFANGGGDYS
jgi:glutamine amidotransferase